MYRFVVFLCIGLVVLTAYKPVHAAQLQALSDHQTGFTIAALSPMARIHGKIVLIDPKRGTFMIHHDPFPAMPMAMTMEVEPKHRSDLRKLHAGEVVDVTIDTRVEPWVGTDIRPASPHPAGAR
jgi:Cu/Ag efflux protein CusF